MKVLHSICNMGTRGLPDMYTLSPRARGPRASGPGTKCMYIYLFMYVYKASFCFLLLHYMYLFFLCVVSIQGSTENQF